jgi:hypothetical protein
MVNRNRTAQEIVTAEAVMRRHRWRERVNGSDYVREIRPVGVRVEPLGVGFLCCTVDYADGSVRRYTCISADYASSVVYSKTMKAKRRRDRERS